MDSYEKCWVFIGMQKIASRLGFTVPRFCCNGHFFSKFLPNRATILVPWRDLGSREQLKIFVKIVPRFFLAWRDFDGGQSLARWPQNRATILSTVVRFYRQRLKMLFLYYGWTSTLKQKSWGENCDTTSVSHTIFLAVLAPRNFLFLKKTILPACVLLSLKMHFIHSDKQEIKTTWT